MENTVSPRDFYQGIASKSVVTNFCKEAEIAFHPVFAIKELPRKIFVSVWSKEVDTEFDPVFSF